MRGEISNLSIFNNIFGIGIYFSVRGDLRSVLHRKRCSELYRVFDLNGSVVVCKIGKLTAVETKVDQPVGNKHGSIVEVCVCVCVWVRV